MRAENLVPLRVLLLAMGLATVPAAIVSPFLAGAAWAQEDDDDDDGGDDDDDDGGGFSSGDDDDDDDWFDDDGPSGVMFPRRSAPAPIAAPVVLPEQADDQIVVRDLDAAGEDVLIAQGFEILARTGDHLLLHVPDDTDVAQALEQVALALPDAVAAPNSYYRSQAIPEGCEGELCAHWDAVGWPPAPVDAICRFEPFIGVIDTGVNVGHDMLSDARIELEQIGAHGAEPSQQKHGTAIVAMLVGDQGERVPGLVPAARLLVVDPFGRVGTDERSDVFALVSALERLEEANVDIASLSLAGPDNALLSDAVLRLQAAGIPVVAAVGNAGPRAAPLYPAAYPDVVAVTAVDGGESVYRRAVQGEHVSFAAPGVNISTAASISGVRPQTGTSFAVPFVTAALAAAMQGGIPADAAIATLAETSRDLGNPGRDDVFGWGLIQMPSPC